IYVGDQKELLLQVAQKNGIQQIYWNRCYEPGQIQKDNEINDLFQKVDIECKTFCAQLLWEPSTIGKAYKIYTPFYKNGCLNSPPPRTPITAPENINTLIDPHNDQFFQKEQWHERLKAHWN